MDVYVIGGGAAGLSSAIAAARCGARVTVLEAALKPADKIRKTGNGKCNFTNMNMSPSDYYSDDNDEFIKTFLYNFDPADALNFFESIGVFHISRSGYVYPFNEEATTVSNALISECEKLGVVIRNNTKVKSVIKLGNEFDIITNTDYIYHADKLIIASGGLAAADKDAANLMYNISTLFGHNIVELRPSLTSLSIKGIEGLEKVKCRAKVTLNGHTECGEIFIGKDGVSGIPIMNLCRHFTKGKDRNVIEFDFVPEFSEEDFYAQLETGVPIERFIPSKLAKLFDQNLISPKHFECVVAKLNDFSHAQVTCGGVVRNEINPNTMESKIVPGLYFAGEIIDVDGKCGGYNLHFAWGSGIIAGTSAAGDKYEHVMPTIDQLRRWEKAEIGQRRESALHE